MGTGLIILGHGSREKEAQETLAKIGQMLQEKRKELVEVASLQFNSPNLSEAIDSLVEKGVRRIIVTPLFLYRGSHMQVDIPKTLKKEASKYQWVEILLARPLGADPKVVEIINSRAEEILQFRGEEISFEANSGSEINRKRKPEDYS